MFFGVIGCWLIDEGFEDLVQEELSTNELKDLEDMQYATLISAGGIQ